MTARRTIRKTYRIVGATLCCGFAIAVGCAPRQESPNVVIFLIDTLRADQLGGYGGTGEVTPNLDALTRESALFENAHAAAPWTLPSVVSLLTSTFPCEHGVLVDGDRIGAGLAPLAERLAAAGYVTGSLYGNPYAGPMSGLDRGFERHELRIGSNGPSVGRWLDEQSEGAFFLYVHNEEPHHPYSEKTLAPERAVEEATRTRVNRLMMRLRRLTRVDFKAGEPVGTTDNSLRQRGIMSRLAEMRSDILSLYARDVARADHRLGTVIAELRKRDLWDRTLFVLVADHGEEFDEHGGWEHDQSVYEELLRVPLLIHFPGGRFAGARVSAPVSLVDVVPTLAEVLEHPQIAAGARGRSLVPLLRGDEPSREDEAPRVTAQRINRKKHFRPFKESRGDENVVVRQGTWKGIWNVETDVLELYDLARDPGEAEDRTAAEPERAEAFLAAAQAWREACPTPDTGRQPAPEIDAESLEQLRALGYSD